MLEALGLPLRGLSVTAPHKEAALAVAGAESPLAARIGAANTLVCRDGVWEAEATDPDGVAAAAAERGIAPAGAAPRRSWVRAAPAASAAVGLAAAGARVTLFNRGIERGLKAAAELGLPFRPLAELDPARFDLLVHATPRGRGAGEPLPFDVERAAPGRGASIDMTYGEAADAAARGGRGAGRRGDRRARGAARPGAGAVPADDRTGAAAGGGAAGARLGCSSPG